MNKALFLDRDGVINEDRGYVVKRKDFVFIEGIFELCQTAKLKDYLCIVVTNQSGIGRGLYDESDFHVLTDWMQEQFDQSSASLDAVYFCPDHPTKGKGKYKVDTERRKPGPGMILEAAADFDLCLAESILIGDKETDIEAAHRAGVGTTVRFMRGEHSAQSTDATTSNSTETKATATIVNLSSAIDLL